MKKYWWLVVVFAVVCTALFVVFSVVTNKTFKVKSTTPKNESSVAIETSEIVIEFNRNIKTDPKPEFIYEAFDDAFSGDLKIDKNKIIVTVKSLDISKEYAFSIKNINSAKGEHIDEYRFSFSTKYVPYSKLDKNTKKKSLEEVDNNKPDPVYQYLPYEDVNIKMYVSTTTGEDGELDIIINVEISLSNADMANDNGAKAFDQYKQTAQDYLRGYGLDLKNYILHYERKQF